MLHVYKIRYGILHCYTSYIPEIKIQIINFSCIMNTFCRMMLSGRIEVVAEAEDC